MFVSKEDYLQSQAEGQKTIAHNICNKTINKNRSDVFPDNDTENLYTLEIWGEFIWGNNPPLRTKQSLDPFLLDVGVFLLVFIWETERDNRESRNIALYERS